MKLKLWVYETDEETESEPMEYVACNCYVSSGEIAPCGEVYGDVLVKGNPVTSTNIIRKGKDKSMELHITGSELQ